MLVLDFRMIRVWGEGDIFEKNISVCFKRVFLGKDFITLGLKKKFYSLKENLSAQKECHSNTASDKNLQLFKKNI